MPYLVNMRAADSVPLNLRSKELISIGRETYCDIQCLDHGMSREHFFIKRKSDDEYVIRDNSSVNGTLLNKERLLPDKDYPIQPGDVVIAGSQSFIVCEKKPLRKSGKCSDCQMPMRTFLETKIVKCPLCGGIVKLSLEK